MPVVVALIAMLVAAAVAGNRRVSANAGVRESAVAASMPRDGVRSSAWYCSGGPVGRGPSGDQVAISDVGPRPVRVALDVMADANDASASATSTVPEHFVTIAANSTTTIPVASLSRSPAAAVVVEPLGDGVVVEQGYSLTGDVAMTPCATRTSSTWYFAAGASVGGTQTWLSLLNPYADDAVVDVEAESESGLRAPGSLQGIVVPHGSRLAVRMDQKVAEQKIVAVTVSVRGGSRIVATQSVVQARRGGGSNASISLGAVAPARTWMFADNRSTAGALQQLVLVEPGGVDATARVTVVPDVATTIEPRIVRVPATSAVAIDFSSVVPPGVSYSLVVHSAVPIVAETRDAYGAVGLGLVTEVGSTNAATRWSFAGGPVTATGRGGNRPRVPAGFDMAVVMKVDASIGQVNNAHRLLLSNGHIQKLHTVTRDAAFQLFRSAVRDNPALLGSVTAAMLPVSFDVAVASSRWIAPLRSYLLAKPGVASVVTLASEGPAFADDVIVLNPGTHSLTVSLVASAGGSVLTRAGMTKVTIAPGRQATISLLALDRVAAAVVVNATAPVVAERLSAGPWGVTRAPGVPWLRG